MGKLKNNGEHGALKRCVTPSSSIHRRHVAEIPGDVQGRKLNTAGDYVTSTPVVYENEDFAKCSNRFDSSP